MDLGLERKVALIAGGSSGLGLAAARELAAEVAIDQQKFGWGIFVARKPAHDAL